MTITLPILADRFNRFNARIFDGKLPPIALRVSSAATRAGSFSKRTIRSGISVTTRRSISISRAFDLPPDALDDVIIHEMIHYWIDLFVTRREPPHGPLFRKMMQDINRVHGRHISVTIATAPDTKRSLHIVCVARLSDGNIDIILPARSRLFTMYRSIPRLFDTVECRWYLSSAAYFNRFPRALKPKLYLPDQAILDEALADARPIDLSSGKLSFPES